MPHLKLFEYKTCALEEGNMIFLWEPTLIRPRKQLLLSNSMVNLIPWFTVDEFEGLLVIAVSAVYSSCFVAPFGPGDFMNNIPLQIVD